MNTFRKENFRPMLGQTAQYTPYPPYPGWMQWAPAPPTIVLPRSPEAGGGVALIAQGGVISQEADGNGMPVAKLPSSGGGITFPVAAAAVAAGAILTSIIA